MIDLDEAKKLCAAPGPWRAHLVDNLQLYVHDARGLIVAEVSALEDAAFIAASRTLVPELIAEVERLGRALQNRDALFAEVCKERDEAEAEVERLRTALELACRIGELAFADSGADDDNETRGLLRRLKELAKVGVP